VRYFYVTRLGNFPRSQLYLPRSLRRIAVEITERRINRELASELLRRSPSDRSTYLKAVIDNPDAQNADATSELGARYRTASVLMDEVVTAKDDEGLFRRSLENIIYNDAHELHRRQQ